jgi:hypothetical protein
MRGKENFRKPTSGVFPEHKNHPDFKAAHFQVVNPFKGNYQQSLQKSDEQFRKDNATHPLESLMSIHVKNSPQPELERVERKGMPLVRLVPHPRTFVDPRYEFRQSAMEHPGGMCGTLAFLFILGRLDDRAIPEILNNFLKNKTAIGKLEDLLDRKDDLVATTKVGHSSALSTLLFRELLLNVHSLNKSFSVSWEKSVQQPGISGASNAPSKPGSHPDISPQRPVHPPMPHAGGMKTEQKTGASAITYFATIGYFRLGDYEGLDDRILRGWTTPEPGNEISHESSSVGISYNGMKAEFTIPRMDRRSRLNRRDNSPMFDPEDTRIGEHLFAQMQRECTRTIAGGRKVEAFPFFLVELSGKGTGFSHIVLVEFNTANGMITTPRGIFDPNYGWLGRQRGFCSLDFDLMLRSVFIANTKPNIPISGSTIICEQLLRMT